MKKIVLILALLLFSFNSFASTDVIENPLIEYKSNVTENSLIENQSGGDLWIYVLITSCGQMAVSYSYEPVSQSQYNEWIAAMEQFYCEEL